MSDAPATSAAEVKEQLLGAAKEMLTSRARAGHRRQRRAPACPTATSCSRRRRSTTSTMTLDDLVVCDLDGNVVEGHRSPTTEKALHLAALRRYPEINATMHCHAKYCTMFALTRQPIPAVIEEFVVYVGGDVGAPTTRPPAPTSSRDEVAGGSATAARCSWPTTGCSRWARTRSDVAAHRAAWSSAPPRSCGARSAWARSCRCPTATNEQFAGYYRYGRTGKF